MPAPHGNFALFALDTIQKTLTWTENRETDNIPQLLWYIAIPCS